MPEGKIEVTEEQMQIIRARLGIEAESFRNSHVGRYIYDRCNNDLDKFRQDLENEDPHNVEKCVEIRNYITVRKLFILWVDEAIRSGLNAEHELDEAEDSTV